MQDIKFSSNNPGSTTLLKVNFQVFEQNSYLAVVYSEETFKLALSFHCASVCVSHNETKAYYCFRENEYGCWRCEKRKTIM